MGSTASKPESRVSLKREAVVPVPPHRRLTSLLLLSTVLILLGGFVDAALWQYSSERDDLLRQNAELRDQLDAAALPSACDAE